jgi:hypothetical protein
MFLILFLSVALGQDVDVDVDPIEDETPIVDIDLDLIDTDTDTLTETEDQISKIEEELLERDEEIEILAAQAAEILRLVALQKGEEIVIEIEDAEVETVDSGSLIEAPDTESI